MEEYLKQNGKIHCLQCNNENISFVSFPFGIFICENCSKEYNNFKKIQRLKNINEKFDPHEMNIIRLSGNERFLNLMKEYSISLTEPSKEYKFLTNISTYYINLLNAEVNKEEKIKDSEEEYNKIIKEKPSLEDGSEIDVDDDDEDDDEELEKFEKKLLEKKEEEKIENKKEKEEKIENKKEEEEKIENKKEEENKESKIKKEENNEKEDKNDKILEKKEEEEKKSKTLMEYAKEDITKTSNYIGGWFNYFGAAIKNSADYIGITPKLQEAKNTIDNSMEKYGFNEMFQKTKETFYNAGNYIIETGKNIRENEQVKNVIGNVNKKYNDFIGKTEKIITEDNSYKEKIKEKLNKDDSSPSNIVNQLKSDL